jgi:hypothetical protein
MLQEMDLEWPVSFREERMMYQKTTIGGYGLRDNDYMILMNAYDFTIDDDGFLHGLLNGDLGYEKTGLKIMYNIIDSFAELPCAGNEKPEGENDVSKTYNSR